MQSIFVNTCLHSKVLVESRSFNTQEYLQCLYYTLQTHFVGMCSVSSQLAWHKRTDNHHSLETLQLLKM